MYLLTFYLLGIMFNIFLFIKGRIEDENSIKDYFDIKFILDLLLIIILSWLVYFIYYIRREGIYL